jgi:hypothetical protein
MNLPPQPPSSEEPEQHPVLHSSEETLIQPSPVSDSSAEGAEETSSEETLIQPSPVSDSGAEGTEQQTTPSATEDMPTLPASSSEPHMTEDIPTLPASSSEPHMEETEQEPVPAFEPDGIAYSALDNNSTADGDTVSDEDEEDEEDDQAVSSQPSRSGVFIRKGVLIAAACAVVVVALLATFLVVASRPKDPPTDWIASFTPPPSSTSTSPSRILYYLHWTNQNGELQGQLQLAAKVNGKLQSITAPATGLYNKDNHIIYVVVTVSGQADTLVGKINATNDTLTLNSPGATDQSTQFVFHTGTANDYKQDTKQLA